MAIWAERYLKTEQDYFDKEYQERSRIQYKLNLRISEISAVLSPGCLRTRQGERDAFLTEGKGGVWGIQKLILILTLIKREQVLHTASARLPWHDQLLLLPTSISARILPVPRGDQGGGREAGKGLFSFQTEAFYKLPILQLFPSAPQKQSYSKCLHITIIHIIPWNLTYRTINRVGFFFF